MFEAKRKIGGIDVTFRAVIQTNFPLFPKVVSVYLATGASATCASWVDAWKMAHDLVRLRREYEAKLNNL